MRREFVLTEDHAFDCGVVVRTGTRVEAMTTERMDDPRHGPSLVCQWGEEGWVGSLPIRLLRPVEDASENSR